MIVAGLQPVDLRGPLGNQVALEVQSELHLQHAAAYEQRIELHGGKLVADTSVTLHRLSTFDEGNELVTAPDARIAIPEPLDVQGLRITANLDHPHSLTINGRQGTEFVDLGPSYNENIVLDGGGLLVSGNQGLGSVNGITEIKSGTTGTLHLQADVTLNEDMRMNDGRGWANAGGLIFERGPQSNGDFSVLRGTVDLGPVGASFGSPATESVMLRFEGKIQGGDLLLKHGSIAIATGNDEHTGRTVVDNGDLELTDQGRIAKSSQIQLNSRLSRLVLNNLSLENTDRVDDSIPVELRGGQFVTRSWSNSNVTERLGPVIAEAGGSVFETDMPIALTSLTRRAGATLQLSGATAEISILNPPTLQGGLLGGWAVIGDNFASLAGTSVVPAERVVRPIAQATNLDNLLIDESRPFDEILAQDTTVNSLSVQGSHSINLNQRTFTVATGGLMFTNQVWLENGRVTAGDNGPSELIIHSDNLTDVNASIVDRGANSVSVVVAGVASFSGNNQYSGSTTVNGALIAKSSASLPVASDLQVEGGLVQLNDGVALNLGQIRMRNGVLFSQLGTIHADQWSIESGTMSMQVVGDEPIVKHTDGTLRLESQMHDYHGVVDVQAGQVLTNASLAAGTNRIDVARHASVGALGRLDTPVRLNGGAIWGVAALPPTDFADVTVTAPSEIVLADLIDAARPQSASVTISNQLIGDGDLRVVGPGMLILAGDGSTYTGQVSLQAAVFSIDNPRALGGG